MCHGPADMRQDDYGVLHLQTPPFEQALPGITIMRLMELIPQVPFRCRQTCSQGTDAQAEGG